ncbi:MAG TPA: hypothetical protein PKE41_02720 [Candidatus Macondimonas sp.]|nr:hypothetical protein [Candidatus Macondimonas sp.]
MSKIAVLTRNYAAHLDPASKKGGAVTFYSNVSWRSIEDAHIAGKHVVVYFIVGESPGEITYEGTLENIVIIPPVEEDTELLEKLLCDAPDDAARQEVEKGTARTIYSVTGVKKLCSPFPQVALCKRSDGKPVSKDYGRGYCIVYPHE